MGHSSWIAAGTVLAGRLTADSDLHLPSMMFHRQPDAAPAGAVAPSRVPAGAVLEGSLSGVADLAIEGRIVGEMKGSEASQEKIMHAIVGTEARATS